jgi:hypothetical protein
LKQGTVSVLVGCHSPVHSLLVLLSWHKLYHKWPNRWQLACIFIHDIGHWGKDYLDNPEDKAQHAILGAKVARKLFGEKGYLFVIDHKSYAEAARSSLYLPDKMSWTSAPIWWMLSNQIFEPKLLRDGKSRWKSATMFRDAMKDNANTGFAKRGHDIYLEQTGRK